MIIVLAGQDRSLEDTLVDYLADRSFTHLDISGDKSGHSSYSFVGERHYVVTGAARPANLATLAENQKAQVIYLGGAPNLDGALGPLFDQAVLRLESQEDATVQLKDFIFETLSMQPRPGWDEYFMDIAKVVAGRSNCMKRQVAAVVVKDHRIIATGYNGTPRGAKNCNEGGCPRCNSLAPAGAQLDECLCNHAEENAIAMAAYHGISIQGSTLYCTFSPCLHCTKLIVNAGIKEMVFDAAYTMEQRSLNLLRECGVEVRHYQGK